MLHSVQFMLQAATEVVRKLQALQRSRRCKGSNNERRTAWPTTATWTAFLSATVRSQAPLCVLKALEWRAERCRKPAGGCTSYEHGAPLAYKWRSSGRPGHVHTTLLVYTTARCSAAGRSSRRSRTTQTAPAAGAGARTVRRLGRATAVGWAAQRRAGSRRRCCRHPPTAASTALQCCLDLFSHPPTLQSPGRQHGGPQWRRRSTGGVSSDDRAH